MKLQDAFIAENGLYVGKFGKIGYEMDAKGAFTYDDKITSETTSLSSEIDGWEATSNVGLNNCAQGGKWTLKISPSKTGNGAAWTASITGANCSDLTPRFGNLTRGEKAGS